MGQYIVLVGKHSAHVACTALVQLYKLLREAKGGARVVAGQASGLPRLRWPSGLCDVMETVAPVGGVGPCSVRVRFPVLRLRRRRRRRHVGIRSSRPLPRHGGALLRRHRRVRGGGVRLCRSVYRSLCRWVPRRHTETAVPAARFIKDAAAASGVAVRGRVDRARFLGTRRRRVWCHGPRSSGCFPGRCTFNGDLNPSTGDYCGSLESFPAMGLLRIWASSGDSGDGNGWRWSPPMPMMGRVLKGFVVISISFRGLGANRLLELYLYPPFSYLYFIVPMYVFLTY